MTTDKLVPFGKYKGQPVERLIADRDYCDWLAGQDWFRSRYGGIHTLIVNYGSEPDETPEHNRMQARLLDLDYCFRVAATVSPVLREDEAYHRAWATERAAELQSEERRNAKYSVGEWVSKISDLRFENQGWDATFQITHACTISTESALWYDSVGIRCLNYLVECKPSLGDDFPKVMRQIMARRGIRGVPILLIDSYAGSGASFDQVREMMKASMIQVVLSSDIQP